MKDRKICVLQLIDGFAVGGAERIVSILARHVNPTCFNLIPCALYRSGPIEDEFKAAGLAYQTLGLRRRSILTGPFFLADLQRILTALSRLLRKFSVDIVHTHLLDSTLFGILAARRVEQIAVCATMHNGRLSRKRGAFSLRERLMQASINLVFSRADRIIGVSSEVTRALLTCTRLPHGRIVTIPNGIDGRQFQCHLDKTALRQKLQLPQQRPIAISIGRLTRQKGFFYLLEALTRMPTSERPLTLIVGEGPARHQLECSAADLQLIGDVRFLGNRSDIPELLSVSDCFVLASLSEGLPLALIEAMAAGVPAVVTSVGGNPGVIEHDKSGLLIPAADPEALAKSLCTLLSDPQRGRCMSAAARKRFDSHFSLETFITAHERLYREMLQERADLILPT